MRSAVAPYTKVPKWVQVAQAQRWFKPTVLRALSLVTEVALGYNDLVCAVSVAKLAALSGMQRNHLQVALAELAAAGAILKTEDGLVIPRETPEQFAGQMKDWAELWASLVRNSDKMSPKLGQDESEIWTNETGWQEESDPNLGPPQAGRTSHGADSEPAIEKSNIYTLHANQKERQQVGLAAIAQGVAWGEGEQEKFLSSLNLPRMRDLGLLMGDTADKVKIYLAFPLESRTKAWAYLEARRAAGEQINKTLGFLVKFLQDPNIYPAIAGINAPAKVAPMRPKDDRPEWLTHLVRNRPTGTTAEFMDALSTAAKYYTLQGFTDVGHNTVLDWAEATTPMDAAKRLHNTLSAQVNARKQAANG